MMDDIQQKIAQFVDNQLSVEESLALLKIIRSQPELLASLNRYQAAAEAMKNESFHYLKPSFLDKVTKELEQEPHYLLPQLKPTNKRNYPAFIALAASFAIAVVLLSQQSQNPQTPEFNKPILASQNTMRLQNKPVVLTASISADSKNQEQDIEYVRYNDYLQAHNASLYTNGNVQFRPYVETVSYQRK